MCDEYLGPEHDFYVDDESGGAPAWKVIRASGTVKFSGPFFAHRVIAGWQRAERESPFAPILEGQSAYAQALKETLRYRLGFHGFCCFASRADCETYLATLTPLESLGEEMAEVRIRGWVKRAYTRVEWSEESGSWVHELPVLLAEQINFDAEAPPNEP